jgi:UDP-N-acetylglucosamine 2-epimerase (non-hydrolysing)
MKIAPVIEALAATGRVRPVLVHTGQHYDENMSRLFFDELGIPKPDVNLEVGSGSHAAQTAEIIRRFEPVCVEHRPDWVLVVGDVNSTIATALVAVKLGVRVAHVEAGLRSFDRSMPEEINRLLTDAISDLLFVTEPSGVENLRREGIAEEKIHLVGNTMIDTLLRHRERAARLPTLETLGLTAGRYAVLTLHRPSNVDDSATFRGILDALNRIAAELPIVFPIHPRTRANLGRLGLGTILDDRTRWRVTDPLGYLDFLKLMTGAALVLTDSGGIQEETTILGVPCLTLRHNTERPVTITQGTNRLVGTDPERILEAYRALRTEPPKPAAPPSLWDGRAAQRIADVILRGA